jgi:hypothetical protein
MFTMQAEDLSALSSSFQEKFGHYFNAQEQLDNKKRITKLLLKELPDRSKNEVRQAVDLAFEHIAVSTRWIDILKYIICLMPGTWYKVATDPGFARTSTMFLMTDGSVLLQESNGSRFKKLTPDDHGSYINGSWSDIAPMNTPRLYYASGVLKDGRLIVAGGEYEGTGTAVRGVKCEIYNPVTNTWTNLPSPPGITQLGDAPCAVLPDGRFMVGAINSVKCAIFDPATDTWTAAADKPTRSSEESWVLLPDNTIVTVRANGSQIADKYLIASDTWVSASTTPFLLVETSSSEIGAGVLMNDGRAFYIGATNRTALYVPPVIPGDPGTWQSGPTIPNNASLQMVGAKDAPACLMTNGHVLMAVGPVDGVSGDFLSPTYFYEFNGSSLVRVPDPPNSGNPPYMGRMLLLPNGQILFTAETNEVYAYTYFGCASSAWRPAITSYPSSVYTGLTYTLHGTQLNGLSQAVGYGDDSTAATNYPLVRIRNLSSGKLRYCRTFNFSTMGVATGTSVQSTSFIVPWNLETGPSEICVVANGISSVCCPIYVHNFIIVWPHDWAYWVRLIGSLADGDLWVLGPHGPIPVDPWGPKYRQQAFEAWETIRHSIGELQIMGNEIELQRLELAEKQAGPQIFETSEEEEKLEKTQEAGEG